MDSSTNSTVHCDDQSPLTTLTRHDTSVSHLYPSREAHEEKNVVSAYEGNVFEASLWNIILNANVIQSAPTVQSSHSPFSCRLALTSRLQLAKLSFESATSFIRTVEQADRHEAHSTVIAINAPGGSIESADCVQTFSGPVVVILASGTPFSLELSAPWEGSNSLTWMSLPSVDLEASCLSDPSKNVTLLALESYDSMDFYSESLIKKNVISDDGSACAINSILTILRDCLSDSKGSQSSSIKIYNAILEYVAANFSDRNLNADTLAKKFNMSKRKLYKLFESLGISVHDKIIEARLDAAYIALTSPKRQKIINIAYDAGFNDVSTFYRQFRKRFGRPPKAQV